MIIQSRMAFKNGLICFSILILLLLHVPVRSVQAMGISPSQIEINDILRGTTQKRIVNILRGAGDVGDLYITVTPMEQNAAFITSGPDEFVMMEGVMMYPYEFEVGPGDAPNGIYEVYLQFLKGAPPNAIKEGDTGVNIRTGVTGKIVVSVDGSEKLAYSLRSIYLSDTEVGRDVYVKYLVDNTGNIDWWIQKIVFEFFSTQSETTNSVATVEVSSDDLEIVRAGELAQEFTLAVPVELEEGSYTATASYYFQDAIVRMLTTPSAFEVFPKGTLEQSGEIKSLTINKESFVSGEKIKLDAVFSNTGAVDTEGLLVAQIYQGDNVYDLVRSSELYVAEGTQETFSTIIDAKDPGTYRIDAYVEFGNRKTQPSSVSYVIESASLSGSFGPSVTLAVILLLLGCLIGGTILQRRRRKGRIQAQEMVAQPLPAPVFEVTTSISSPPVVTLPPQVSAEPIQGNPSTTASDKQDFPPTVG